LSLRVCLGCVGIDAEPGLGLRGRHSGARSSAGGQHRHDVERGLAALSLCRIHSRSALLPRDHEEERQFSRPRRQVALVLLGHGNVHGALWFGSIVCYSLSTVKLGDLGAVIGWPLFLSAVVIGSTITGILAGEWKRAGTGPMRMMGAG